MNANLVCRQEPAALNEYGMDEQIEVVVYVSTGPESIYTANLEYKYTLFNEEESASFRVVYIDSNGNEKLIEERTVFKGENAVCNYSVSLTAPAEYTVYVYKNGQLYESFPLYFTTRKAIQPIRTRERLLLISPFLINPPLMKWYILKEASG